MNKKVKFTAKAAAFGLIAGMLFQGVEYAGHSMWKTQIEPQEEKETKKAVTTNVLSDAGTTSSDVSDIAEQVLPSIVAIDVTATVTQNTPFGVQSGETTGSGSGILIAEKDEKLYIATNNHVVEGADKVTITFNDGTTAEASVKGTDSTADLAVVMVEQSKLSEETKSSIKIAVMGDSTETKVGEQAIAIGNALGYGTSVTVGYISAKDREIQAEDSAGIKLFQTDAAINPGNSGGALVNSRGEVIGINSSKFASEEIEGMGFAIPMATAQPILTELMEQEDIDEEEQAYLGISGRDVTDEYTQAYGLPEGIYVAEVSAGSPAEKAGLKAGYIITGLNDSEVTTLSGLQEKLSRCRAGEKGTITVKVMSGGGYEEKTFEVTFGKKESANQ